MATSLPHVTSVVTGFTVGFRMGCMTYCVLIGCSHNNLGWLTATQFRISELVEIRLGEMKFAIQT